MPTDETKPELVAMLDRAREQEGIHLASLAERRT